VLSIGDFFLDRYWTVDPSLAEISLETGLRANQIVDARCAPGGAGTVAKNLCALGAGRTITLGIIGDDGEGSDLVKSLGALGADTSRIIVDPDTRTPTYTKPISFAQGIPKEWERFDAKNRAPTQSTLEDRVIDAVHAVISDVDAVVVSDQVEEEGCGVITDRVRDVLCSLASQHAGVVFIADSRARIASFVSMRIKPNRTEAMRAVGSEVAHPTREDIERAAEVLRSRTARPVFITCGAEGIFVHTDRRSEMVAGFEVKAETDSVGAGDNAMAAIAASLAGGADDFEAAMIGNLAGAVTVRKIGETGSSSQDEMLDLFRAAQAETGGSP
jgi:rfaE bifunctional protein kinase chain/domain